MTKNLMSEKICSVLKNME